ncbi:heavy metal-binding domain-containing protein [uncultured Thiodictyon sp.]|uniref:heavy metal-binding domain-containing protein n=1 Tax=uncultured Thiodictyon sp. TaxID=1846217 RepID=UPI0025DA741D|nr:heavy metal-binding domain-containing protein [uncultured Thiodictyon sp.]
MIYSRQWLIRPTSFRVLIKVASLTLILLGPGYGRAATPPADAPPPATMAPAQMTMEHAKPQEHSATYLCPMHPQVVSSQPGRCPICGMDLVAKQADAAPMQESAMPEHAGEAMEPTKGHQHAVTYSCPMHPQVVSSQPGRCPICGMDLVAKQAEAAPMPGPAMPGHPTHEAAAVTVPAAVVNQLGVRTAKVQRGTLTRHVEGFGVFLRSTVQGYRPIYHGPAPSVDDTGTSTSALLVQGQVFERQAPLLHEGQTVWVQVPGLGAKVWKGKLIGLEAQINQTTHTQVFHVAVAPEAASVPPGMNANLVVEVDPVPDALLVPREAVIVTGRGARVMVALPDGRFVSRTVEAADSGEEQIVIRAGLDDGERVVVSAQFLLDSEANLQAGLKRLTGEESQVEAPRMGAAL